MQVKTTNSYEAAFYLMHQADLVDIEVRPLAENKRDKAGFSKQWIFILENVNEKDYDQWKNYKAFGNLRAFEEARVKLKKKIRTKWRR